MLIEANHEEAAGNSGNSNCNGTSLIWGGGAEDLKIEFYSRLETRLRNPLGLYRTSGKRKKHFSFKDSYGQKGLALKCLRGGSMHEWANLQASRYLFIMPKATKSIFKSFHQGNFAMFVSVNQIFGRSLTTRSEYREGCI